MTTLDELEARLREACRDFDGTEMDASWDVQAEDLLTYGELRQAADAIAELRVKNAGLVGALRGITPDALQDGWWCPECQDWIAVATNHECCPSCGTYLTDVQPSQEWHTKALAALKENTQ